MKKLRVWIVVALAAALAVVGCSPGSSGGTQADDTFVIAANFATDSLDPQGTSAQATGNSLADKAIYSRLVAQDSNGKIQPDLAEKWTSNATGTQWTFTLRDGVVFSDGTPLTADDVVASFDRLMKIKGPLAGNFTDVTAKAVDDHTVEFDSPTMLLLGRVALLYVAKKDVTDDSFTQPIGSGPYVVTDFKPGVSLKLAPNDKYYGTKPTMNVEFRWIPDLSTRLTALKTGEVDATWGIPDDQVAPLRNDADLTVKTIPSTSVITMWMNASRPAFAKASVRNALWEAVDFKTIISSLFPETGSLSDSIVAPNVLGYSKMTPKPYDPEAAKAALTKAGFDFDKTYEIQYNGPEYTQFIQAVASDLNKIGVKAEPKLKEPAVFLDDLLKLNWDINFQALGTAAYDAATNTGRLYPCAAKRTGYCNPDLDKILAAAGNTTDEAKRVELYNQANKIIWDDAVGMFPMVLKATYAWRNNVTGFTPDPLLMPDLSHVAIQK